MRIRRLLTEVEPALPDFDGERVAQERNYKSLSLADGLEAFRRARAENLAALRALIAIANGSAVARRKASDASVSATSRR